VNDRALRRTEAVVSLKSLASFDDLGVEFSIEDMSWRTMWGQPDDRC
jgi:hypothetical protein